MALLTSLSEDYSISASMRDGSGALVCLKTMSLITLKRFRISSHGPASTAWFGKPLVLQAYTPLCRWCFKTLGF